MLYHLTNCSETAEAPWSIQSTQEDHEQVEEISVMYEPLVISFKSGYTLQNDHA